MTNMGLIAGLQSLLRSSFRSLKTSANWSRLFVCCLVVLMAFFCCLGQSQQDKTQSPVTTTKQGGGPTGPSPGEAGPNIVISPGKDYLISPGDVLEIQVEDAPELSHSYRVPSSGKFNFGIIGLINAQRKTTEVLATMITDGLRGRYLKNPQVNVTITQFNSQSYFIQGAVTKPGVYQMEGRPNMLELLTIAGGLAQNHGSTAFIIRKIKQGQEVKPNSAEVTNQGTSADLSKNPAKPAIEPNTEPNTEDDDVAKYELVIANISGLLKGNFDQNVSIHPGDIINIPQTYIFFVAGEVRSPGSFPLREGTTLQQAISMAQGMTFKSKPGNGIIFREDPKTGKREEVKIDIGAIMAGKKPDVPILANDVIIVPNSRFKSVGGTLLSGLGSQAIRIPIY